MVPSSHSTITSLEPFNQKLKHARLHHNNGEHFFGLWSNYDQVILCVVKNNFRYSPKRWRTNQKMPIEVNLQWKTSSTKNIIDNPADGRLLKTQHESVNKSILPTEPLEHYLFRCGGKRGYLLELNKKRRLEAKSLCSFSFSFKRRKVQSRLVKNLGRFPPIGPPQIPS